MKEYIEREKALEAIRKINTVGGCAAYDCDSVEEAIDSVIVADVQEVVYCKDCKFWDNGRCEGIENGLIYEHTKPTDFCSYGAKNG